MGLVRGRVNPGWLSEVERDVLALGGVVFYVLVLGRSLVGPFWDLVVPLTVIGLGLLLAAPLLHGTDLYVTRSAVVAVLVTLHYEDPVFGAFAAVAFAGLIAAALHLGRSRAGVVRGLVLGLVLAAVGTALGVWAS
jgi:hypothetical protein